MKELAADIASELPKLRETLKSLESTVKFNSGYSSVKVQNNELPRFKDLA